jgi:hypothetical protein
MRKLQVTDQGSSGKVTLDKEFLEYDDLVVDSEVRDDLYVKHKHVGRGVFQVIILDENLTPFDPRLQQFRHAEVGLDLEAAD